jgi:predicted ATP-dependent endonuclease of OLD family
MYIERVQIEEGFLDGLDIALVPGLNVVIGARGTGKTSLIELIKFCLDAQGHTPETSKRSYDHAMSVLGSGQVTVTISDGSRKVSVSRTASDSTPRTSGAYVTPLVFSQTEIESVGLQVSGRLSLLSSFTKITTESAAEADAVSETRSLTAQAGELRREIDELQRRLTEIPTIDAELQKIAPSEQQLSTFSAESGIRKQKLDALSADIAKESVAAVVLERLKMGLFRWRNTIDAAVAGIPHAEQWPERAGPDPLKSINAKLAEAKAHLKMALSAIESAEIDAVNIATSRNSIRHAAEDRSRQLRKELDALHAGAGTITRKGQQLRERKAQLEALKALLAQRKENLEGLLFKRIAVLDRIEQLRDDRFAARSHVAADLNRVLAPRIRISVSRAGQFDAFSAAIADALKGSGLRYGDLAPALAKTVSPRELLEAAENDEVDFIADATGISSDRAARLLAHLRETDLGAIGTASVEDLVDFQLLDGSDYKDIGELSTGQRCTVVLPIVLRHTERILIVDQPEDHIDNAFIADTLIQSVLARDEDSQIIFSSHNANIPVLGNANHVVQMASDGKRGFALASDGLETSKVVKAITSVMEGGIQAFEKRQSFYERHKSK